MDGTCPNNLLDDAELCKVLVCFRAVGKAEHGCNCCLSVRGVGVEGWYECVVLVWEVVVSSPLFHFCLLLCIFSSTHSHLRDNVLIGWSQHDGYKLVQDPLIRGYL